MKPLKYISSFLASLLLVALCAGQAIAAAVDVNSADARAIADALSGVGPKTAAAIVTYRKQHGPFKVVEDLLNVKGIGPKTLERNRKDITLGKPASAKK